MICCSTNLNTFFVRYPHLTERDVAPVDYVWKTFEVPHIYNFRGLYNIMINGFDERSYAEETHHITVFKMPCKVPKVNTGTQLKGSVNVQSKVWLPVNETSWKRPERIPKTMMSKPYQANING